MSELATSLNLKQVRGILVNSVDADGPGERAGLRPGDVITAGNATRVDNANALRNQIAGTAPGKEVALTVLRDAREQEIRAKLGELPANKESIDSDTAQKESRRDQLGITVEPLTPELSRQLNVQPGTQGVVVTDVDPSGPAAEAGIEPDDVILQVNREPIKSAVELRAALGRSAGRPALLLLSRGGRSLFLAVQPR
jgi:serine protease Do